jgi:hypothetical protein
LKILIVCGLLSAAAFVARGQDNYADTVVSYVSGTGSAATQHSTYQSPAVALGAPASSSTISAPAYSTSELCVLNAGGELTLGFNSPITNNPAGHADGMDFTIFGNEFFVGGSPISGTYDHPGLTVWVSQDDVNFYELDVPNGYGADDSFPTESSGNPFLPVSPALTLSSFVGESTTQALSLYNGSAGGASFSISWAVDAEGNPVDLSSINEIEIEGPNPAAVAAGDTYGLVDAVTRVESVPEPSCAALVFASIGLLAIFRRRHLDVKGMFIRK